MLSETQLSEIRNYLLSKKLPIDILIEVNDHFISQISDLQREENLGFEVVMVGRFFFRLFVFKIV